MTQTTTNPDTASAKPFKPAPFGTQFASQMGIAWYRDGKWSDTEIVPADELRFHPGTHVFHYGSSCFEGQKAYLQPNGDVCVFRIDKNVARLRQSAALLYMPQPSEDQLKSMILETLRANRKEVPPPPAAMYIRPTLIGTERSIGKAAKPSAEACLFVLLSPVGDYFEGGMKPLKLLIDDENMRVAPHAGMVKAGANYASALPHIMRAREKYNADQVLFCPGGIAQETGAANFLLFDEKRIVTKDLDSSFLHGITRDSILKLAAKRGMTVEERPIPIQEILDWCANGEAALSGTAAVLASVGSFVYQDKTYVVGNGEVGPVTSALRQALVDIQLGHAEDPFNWLTKV